jgi:hypothetical protein
MEILIKKYEHFNRSFRNWDSPKGRYISSRSDYEKAMREEGMIPYEQAKEIAQKEQAKREEYPNKLSPKAMSLLTSVNVKKDGKIKLSDRQVKGLEAVGVKVKLPDWLPKHYQEKGEFVKG